MDGNFPGGSFPDTDFLQSFGNLQKSSESKFFFKMIGVSY